MTPEKNVWSCNIIPVDQVVTETKLAVSWTYMFDGVNGIIGASWLVYKCDCMLYFELIVTALITKPHDSRNVSR